MARALRELSNLEGRVALVTGGAGHIGRTVVETLIELGATVASADRESPASANAFKVDFESENETRGLIEKVAGKFGRLDILVHCAAFVGRTSVDGWAVPLDQQSVQAWDRAMRVNTTAAFVLAQESRPLLQGSGRGTIILVGSIYGLVSPDRALYAGTEMHSPAGYSASKGAVIQLTRHLATELAPQIRVNCLTPGGVYRGQPEAFVQRYITRTPLGRMASEEDLKGAIAYLASDLSAYVTGHNLIVDGGFTAW